MRLILLLVLFGCGRSHTTHPDAGLDLDSSASDASLDSAFDVGFDAGEIAPTSCSGSLIAMDGDGCFCQGAFVVDGVVGYRTGYDLETHDLSGGGVVLTQRTTQSRPGSEGALFLHGDTLYAGDWGIEAFDVSDRSRPVSIGVVDVEGTVTDLLVIDDALWVVSDEREGEEQVGYLRSYDARALVRLHSMRLEGEPGSLLRYGDDEVVVLEKRRFGEEGADTALIVDVSERPRIEERIELRGRAVLRRRGAIEGDRLYVTGIAPLLQIVDLPSRRVVSQLEAPDGGGTGLGIGVSGPLAFVGGSQIQVADVSNVDTPRWIGMLEAPSDIHHVERHGDSVFIGTGGYLGRISLDCR